MSDTSEDADVLKEVLGDPSVDVARCTKLTIADNILACIENRELDREIEEIKREEGLLENVMTNYVIAKKIIGHLSWQEKFISKHVCLMWHSVVLALQKEQLEPSDFVMDLPVTIPRSNVAFKKSGNFYTEPLAVLTFANMQGFPVASKCEAITPHLCSPTCENAHCLIDVAQYNTCLPKDCMLTAIASYLVYMPLSQSVTYEHVFTQQMFVHSNPFISGIYIPIIPDVEFKVINIKSVANMQNDFFDVVRTISRDRIFKGVIAYVTEIYLLQTIEDIVFLNYFKEVQPDIPYALGGCIVEDTIYGQDNINAIVQSNNKPACDFMSENLVTVALFTVPKDSNLCNFDMYSLIVESTEWAKSKIKKSIEEFAKKVPQFEHSVAIKLSCVGRDQKHEAEQKFFRAAFPHTRLIGCYGNGELGVNHPAKPTDDVPSSVKKHRIDPGPQYGIMYSYSTVFLYMGWGRKYAPESN